MFGMALLFALSGGKMGWMAKIMLGAKKKSKS
jgi:hypothetical protein